MSLKKVFVSRIYKSTDKEAMANIKVLKSSGYTISHFFHTNCPVYHLTKASTQNVNLHNHFGPHSYFRSLFEFIY